MAIPIRVWIGVMVFFSAFVNYSVVTNMSMAIVSMTVVTGKALVPECIREKGEEKQEGNTTTEPPPQPDYGPRYSWDETMQSHVLSSFFYGFTIISLPAGAIAEWAGPYYTILVSSVITAILNSACVFAAWYHYSVLMACRFVMGCVGAVVYPALQCMIARWSPPEEKSKFVACLFGNNLGTTLTWFSVGVITESFGWAWGFHALSIFIAVYCCVFGLLVSDGPESHPWISEEEKNFIIDSHGGTVNKKRAIPPYKAMFFSIPFWALVVCHYSNLWGLFLQMTSAPKFVSGVLGYTLKETGAIAAMPQLVRLFLGFGFGILGDYLKKSGKASPKFIRKFFILFSHVIPGLMMGGMYFTGCFREATIVLLILSQSINGSIVLTNLLNAQDLAPNFAGTIFGIMTFIGGTAGIISPVVTGIIIKQNNGALEWGYVFLLGATIYILGGIVFVLIGSAELQPWNQKSEE